MEKVYGDSETTCQNIASLMKNSRSSQAVTLAVANRFLLFCTGKTFTVMSIAPGLFSLK